MNYEMQETRSRILQLLKTRSKMTASELAESLAISSIGVRQHLTILERDGLVEHHRQKSKRGRPMHFYYLTDKASSLFPATYGSFAVNLLKEVEELNGPDSIDRIFQNRMKSQLNVYKQRMDGKILGERVRELSQIRDEEGYMTEVVEEEGDYIFNEYNCPIAMIAEKYSHACNAELALLRQSLGARVEREDHLMDDSHKCSYRIRKLIDDNQSDQD